MKKNVFLLLVFCFSMSLFSQEGSNKFDNKNRRHGLWKGLHEESQRPRYEGTFNHGKETGIFKFFEDNETSTLAATRDFAKDGSCYTTFYDVKGNKTGEGREINRERVGEWRFYHPGSKALMSIEQYTKGKLTGKRKIYFPNGSIAEEIEYNNGIKNGIYKKYTEKGIVLEDSKYKNGKFHGLAIFRDAQGNIAAQGQFTEGLKTGIWKFYKDGKVVKEQDMSAPRTARKAPK